MSNALGMLVVAGAAYYAFTQGWLDSILPAQPATAASVAAITPASLTGQGVAVVPPVASNVSHWEAKLIEHDLVVQPWARKHRKWVAAMMRTESGHIGPDAVSSKGALGLLQVMPATRDYIYKSGYTRFPNTNDALKTEAGGIYYGTAYMEILAKHHPDEKWVTHGYFGGEGWDGKGPNYKKQCEDYWKLVSANYRKNEGVSA